MFSVSFEIRNKVSGFGFSKQPELKNRFEMQKLINESSLKITFQSIIIPFVFSIMCRFHIFPDVVMIVFFADSFARACTRKMVWYRRCLLLWILKCRPILSGFSLIFSNAVGFELGQFSTVSNHREAFP